MNTSQLAVTDAVPFAWAVVTNRNTSLVGYDNVPVDTPAYDPVMQLSYNVLAASDKSWCELNSTGDFLIGKDKDTSQDD